jgi:hypothetical protein
VYIDNGATKLISRKGNVYKSFPELAPALAACIEAYTQFYTPRWSTWAAMAVPSSDWIDRKDVQRRMQALIELAERCLEAEREESDSVRGSAPNHSPKVK